MSLHLSAKMEQAMDDKGADLLGKCALLFMRFGIKSMTMDDISRHLGISKKTLYLYVTDKNDLVVKVMQHIVAREQERANAVCLAMDNAIDMLFSLSKEIGQRFGQIHPSINYDLQKYHPEAWDIFNNYQTQFVSRCVEENIQKGIEQGLYRDNLDPKVISRLYSANIHLCIDTETFPAEKYGFHKLHLEMLRYHIRGIASETGLAYLKEKVKQENLQL